MGVTSNDIISTVTSCWDLDVLPPKNGKRTGNEFGIGSTVSFSCNQGYELIGNSSLTCQSDGQWSGIVPICEGLERFRLCVNLFHLLLLLLLVLVVVVVVVVVVLLLLLLLLLLPLFALLFS